LRDFAIRVCGVTLRITAEDGAFLGAARRRYAPFQAAGTEDVRLRIELVDAPLRPPPEEPLVGESGSAVRVERHDLEMDLGPRGGGARVLRTASALDSALRIALSFAVARRGGFLCHAAAVDGWLFPGRSGDGKSTLGLAAPEDRLLADEHTGVLDGWLHGTPFWGDFRPGLNNGSHRLEAVFLLDRNAPRGVRAIPKAQALARILECALFFSDRPAWSRRLLRAAKACVGSVPAFVLSYDARRTRFSCLEAMLKRAIR
jgi:hypothetical protein